jgi:hypothetical protein
MDLQSALELCEKLEPPLVIDLDLGVHRYCSLDSNCPKAVELRKMLAEAGITEEQLEEVRRQGGPLGDIYWPLEPPKVEAALNVQIGNISFELDTSQAIQESIQSALRWKRAEYEEATRLSASYLYGFRVEAERKIRKAQDHRSLPALSFSLEELAETGALITTSYREYLIAFPVVYAPQYMVRGGVRYELAEQDKINLVRDCLLVFSLEGKTIHPPRITDRVGGSFEHYHGNDRNDCWGGSFIFPQWTGSLKQLFDLSKQLMAMLATINLDSMMIREPRWMPYAPDLLDRATELGVEGEITSESMETTQETAPPRRGWR